MKKVQKNKNKRKSNFILFLLSYLLLIIFGGLVAGNYYISRHVQERVLPVRVRSAAISAYPMFRFPYEPFISAQSAIIMEDQTKRILYVKNPTLRLSTASTAKIMTALVALDHYKPNDVLVVKGSKYEGTVVGFPQGESVYFDDILYALLLPSGNDAAYTIAENYPGGKEAFVSEMNEKAKKFHLKNTHFADPAGLEDDGSYMTVVDLARLCAEAMKNPVFSRVVSTKEKIFSTPTGNTYDVFNINKLLGTNGVIGIKTGQTMGAGEVLTTAKMEGGRKFIIVVMQSTDRFGDTQSLLNLITNNITYFSPK